MISFGANYIKPAILQEINTKTRAVSGNFEASCVELNPADSMDLDAVRDVSKQWRSPEAYSDVIELCMERIAKNGVNPKGDKFYAITAQKENFATLEPGKVLALSQLIETTDKKNKKEILLKYLQVKPDSAKKTVKFNHIGSEMLNLIKKLFPDKNIRVYSDPNAIEFYLANGFKKTGICFDEMLYKHLSFFNGAPLKGKTKADIRILSKNI